MLLPQQSKISKTKVIKHLLLTAMRQERLSNLALSAVHTVWKISIIASNIISNFAEIKVRNIFYGKHKIVYELLMSYDYYSSNIIGPSVECSDMYNNWIY